MGGLGGRKGNLNFFLKEGKGMFGLAFASKTLLLREWVGIDQRGESTGMNRRV